jgi:DnaJ-domain-containing protein 1
LPVNGDLQARVLDLLEARPAGYSEFDLLRLLQTQAGEAFDAQLFRDNLSMYRAHFLLFHLLYRLRETLASRRKGLLQIHVLNIRLQPWQTASAAGLVAADPLRDYYLDLENLENTRAADVEALLGSFWSGYLARERQAEALETLGLEPGASRREIEQRFRRLAMRHHPDRGGDQADFLVISEAVEVLRRC